MRGLILAFSAVVLSLAPLPASAAKDHGFSGHWQLDRKNFQGSEPLADLRQDIKQSGSELIIANRFPEPASGVAPLLYLGIMTTEIHLKTDGQEMTTQVGPFPFTSKSTMDGNRITTEWTSVFKGDPVQGKWVRTLSEDGKRMTLEITETSTKGQQGSATLQFVRK